MKSKKRIRVLIPIILVVWHLTGYSSEDRLIKNFGGWPVVKIDVDNSNRVHLIITTGVGRGSLGYYQYDFNDGIFIDSIPVLDSSTHAAQFPVCAISENNILISYEENYPNISMFLLLTQIISLKEVKQSTTLKIKEYASWLGMSENIAFNDSIFYVVWVSWEDNAIFGQFITNLNTLEGSYFQINDSLVDCNITPAGIDHNPSNRHFVAIWSDNHNGEYKLYGRVFSQDQSDWGATLELSDSFQIDNYTIWFPKVFWGTDTSFTVFFRIENGNLYYQSFNLIGEAQIPKRMVNNLPGSVDDFTCIRDNLGRLVAVWEDIESGKILCQRFRADGSLIDTVFTVTTGIYQVPIRSLSADFRDGKVAVVWNDADYRVWLNVFDFDNPVKVKPTQPESVPHGFQLAGNYPNPLNATTKIRFFLPQLVPVSLQVWDCRGTLVREQSYQPTSSGWQALEFDGSGLPSGIYLYAVSAFRQRAYGKLVLLK